MTLRAAVVFFAATTLLLAGCDNSSERAKQAAQEPPTAPPVAPPSIATAPTPAPAPAPAPVAEPEMAKPPGVDPAKLAEHAKALSELGYKDEAAKLYGHACNWGYSPACAKLKTSTARLAGHEAMPTQVVAQPAPVKPAPTKPAAVVAQAPTTKPFAPPAAPSVTAHPSSSAPSASPTASPPAPPAPATVAPLPPPPAPANPPPVVVASVKPTPAIEKPAAPVDTHKLNQQAQGLEEMGYLPVAIKLYKDACLAGDGQACKRLGEIYIQGSEGVERDYAESVRWYGRARQLGIAVPTLEKRSVYR